MPGQIFEYPNLLTQQMSEPIPNVLFSPSPDISNFPTKKSDENSMNDLANVIGRSFKYFDRTGNSGKLRDWKWSLVLGHFSNFKADDPRQKSKFWILKILVKSPMSSPSCKNMHKNIIRDFGFTHNMFQVSESKPDPSDFANELPRPQLSTKDWPLGKLDLLPRCQHSRRSAVVGRNVRKIPKKSLFFNRIANKSLIDHFKETYMEESNQSAVLFPRGISRQKSNTKQAESWSSLTRYYPSSAEGL